MSGFDVDLDGIEGQLARLEELRDDFSDTPVYVVSSNAEYAVYLEFGTEDMPPYPSFRPAIFEFEANPEAFLLKNSELGGLGEIESSEQLVKSVAFALERQITINANANALNRSPGTHPDHPKIQSGNLAARISAQRVG